MRFSSIFITAVLAAIAGSAIAVPGLLHARDLAEVTDLDGYRRESGAAVLEREEDGEHVDKTLTHQPALTLHHYAHSVVADKYDDAIQANSHAAEDADVASQWATSRSDRERFQEASAHHADVVNLLRSKRDEHREAARSSVPTSLYSHVEEDWTDANKSEGKAKKTSEEARNYYLARATSRAHHHQRYLEGILGFLRAYVLL